MSHADHAALAGSALSWARRLPHLRRETVVAICAFFLVPVAVVLGGSSQGNALAETIVELASLPLLFVALYTLLTFGAPAGTRFALCILFATLAVPLLQLDPVPVPLWQDLPHRMLAQQAASSAGIALGAQPLSLAPEGTWRAFLSLLPPAAMFLGALHMSQRQRRALLVLWIGLATLSLLLGMVQLLSGPGSSLYFYEVTNNLSPVGFFANRNHEAAFLLCLMPAAAMFATQMRGGFADRRLAASILAALYLPLVIVSVAVGLSRAGIALSGAAILASVAVALRGEKSRSRWRAPLAIGIGSAAAVAAVVLFGLTPILERFATEDPGDLRFNGWPVVLQVARDYLPFGSGVGSFDAIYRTVEPLSQVSPVYFNHAHNDYLEIWLETGVAGAALLAAFAAWFIWRTARIWAARPSTAGQSQLAAASSMLVLLLLAHSAVDYPLRTEAISVLFAFACGNVAINGRKTKATANTQGIEMIEWPVSAGSALGQNGKTAMLLSLRHRKIPLAR